MLPKDPARTAAPGAVDLDQAACFWDGRVNRPDEECRHWLESRQASARVNALTTGDPDKYPLSAFAEDFRRVLPVPRALSIGCGTGSLEREAVLAGIAEYIDGIDISKAALERAAGLSRSDPLVAERITYRLADAASWLATAEPGRYQVIFFHGSLHHIAALETVISACAAMLRACPPGLLFVDEYIGPSRDRWCETDLSPARELFARLAPEHRRTPQLMQPMDPSDPSEMVRSGEIEPILRAHFETLKYRPYYGNVIYPLLSTVKGSSFSHPDVERVIRDAIAREDSLIGAGGIRPLFALFIARPRSPQEADARAEAWRRRHDAASPPAADGVPRPCYELELDLRRLLAERAAEQHALYAEIRRLNSHVRAMESTRAWQLHDWLERRLRRSWRRVKNLGKRMIARRRE